MLGEDILDQAQALQSQVAGDTGGLCPLLTLCLDSGDVILSYADGEVVRKHKAGGHSVLRPSRGRSPANA
jgi:hypothetical protein